jgi:acetylornithine/succinyldiaminopimelate/putrescine aminotransferase
MTHRSPTETGLLPQSLRAILRDLSIARADNDVLIATDGREYIDLFAGCGTVLLGHLNPAITSAMHQQLDTIWTTGALQTPVRTRAEMLVESFFPSTHRLAALYSTGMEASEFALRVSRVATGRRGVVGFDGCMHGKSTATAYLGWDNPLVSLPDFQRLPYVSTHPESQILEQLDQTLAEGSISAVFMEPLQGSSGGHLASPDFYQKVEVLCRLHGAMLVVDEIFSGFHRTGEPFLFPGLGISPDIVLAGKAMGNGFPVSAVVVDKKHAIQPAMLAGSTYAGNALASAAVVATLSEMKAMDMQSTIGRIADTIRMHVSPLEETGIAVRGLGALWILELPADCIDKAVALIFQGGVVVAPTASYIRLLPPATISGEHLVKACAVIREAIEEVMS